MLESFQKLVGLEKMSLKGDDEAKTASFRQKMHKINFKMKQKEVEL